MDTLSEITSHIGATTTTTDPSEIWISDLTGLFHMMNFVFTKRNFFTAIDIFAWIYLCNLTRYYSWNQMQ